MSLLSANLGNLQDDPSGEFKLNLGELDITSEDVDFGEIDEDLSKFQQDFTFKEILEKNVDLRSYSKQVEQDLHAVERESIDDYLVEAEHIAQLYHEIRTCDGVLERMEKMLSGFQSDLGNISEEIKTLQHDSFTMNVKLKNRQALEKKLSEFIDSLTLPPPLIDKVCNADVNETYLEYLLELSDKSNFLKRDVQKYAPHTSPLALPAIADVQPNLEKLCFKAVFKVRDFLLSKINTLKKPQTNIQILQQNVLMRFRYFNEFLREQHEAAAEEVRATYVDTVSKLYLNYFRLYLSNLDKLEMSVSTKADLIGEKESVTKGMSVSNLFGKSSATKSRAHNVFALNDRDSVVKCVLEPSIVAHIASEKHQKFTYEALFRSVNVMLVDAATSEYVFCMDFFNDHELFAAIFEKTLDAIVENLQRYLADTFDSVGIFLLIRLTHEFHLVMSRRRIPCLDAYYDRLKLLLWPKFKLIFDANIESVKTAKAAELFSGDVHVHYITRRYAEFAASLGTVNQGNENPDVMTSSLSFLRSHVESLLSKMSGLLTNAKDQIVFLINNYDVVLGVLLERGLQNEDVARFQELLGLQTAAFVEEELSDCYGRLIAFIKRVEPVLVKSDTFEQNRARINPVELEQLAKDFATSWKGGIKHIDENMRRYFSNFNNGKQILKQTFTQLLLYYTRFTAVVDQCYANPPFRKEIIPQQVMMYEFKNYIKDF